MSGTGDTDNSSFTIDGTSLKTSSSFDYETKSSNVTNVEDEAPTTPTGLAVTKVTNNLVTVSWNASSDDIGEQAQPLTG